MSLKKETDMEKHLQIISCSMSDSRTRMIVEYFAKKAYERKLKYKLFLDLKHQKIRFILYAEKIFDIKLNFKTVLSREKV